MKTRLQIPTTTRKMRKRALRTRNEIYSGFFLSRPRSTRLSIPSTGGAAP